MIDLTGDREAKRAHFRRLRDAAVALVRERGNWDGNFEFNGQLNVARCLTDGRLYTNTGHHGISTGVDRGERRPTTYQINIKYDGDRVLALGWDGDRVNLISYEHGAWERLLHTVV